MSIFNILTFTAEYNSYCNVICGYPTVNVDFSFNDFELSK